MQLRKQYIQVSRLFLLLFFAIFLSFFVWAQDSDEETYSISLVKTAEVDKEIIEIDNRKVLTETYTVQEGDRIWKIFRERDLLTDKNLSLLLYTLKRLNKSLENLDLIHPGEKIIVPLRITPIAGASIVEGKEQPSPIPLEKLDDIELQNYTIQPGDSISKVVYGLYDIPFDEFYYEYLSRLKELNPSIEDLNVVHPGQVIRLPIYSPKIVRMPIKKAPPPKSESISIESKGQLSKLGDELGKIFRLLGEDWVNSGKHFIPLKSGGQINLNADSYPIINFSNGNRIIVDIFNELPERMAELIQKDWGNYIIVHLDPTDDLKQALKKILPHCGYEGVHGRGESFELAGDVSLTITADWIIRRSIEEQDGSETIIMLTICESEARIPKTIENYMNRLGIKVIEYPLINESIIEEVNRDNIMKLEGDEYTLTESVLNMVGQDYTQDMEIPVYQSERDDFSLIISPDFFFNRNGMDKIIDITGLGSEIVEMLKEQQLGILQLSSTEGPLSSAQKILEFLEIRFESGRHEFVTTNRDISRNVIMTIPGILFKDKDANEVFITQTLLPDEVADFLTTKDLKIFQLINEK